MKLAKALAILRRLADHEIQLRQMVSEADERAIYTEMQRRGLVWSGKQWITARPIDEIDNPQSG